MKRRLWMIVGLCTAISAAVLFAVRPWTWQKLDLEKITSPPRMTVIYDRNGSEALNVGTVRRVMLRPEDISQVVKDAFVSIEDARFYTHHGVDFWRIGGALVSNIKSGSVREGASTITQQLIKLTHLSSEKTLARKAQEAWLALRLERLMSKDEILCAYLNTAYFGAGAYGIEAAARAYFDCSASNLTLSQAALLAGIVKSPSGYAPHIHPERAKERRNLVLEQMAKNGYISEEDMEAARNETIELAVQREQVSGWYGDAVVDEACALLNISADQLMNGGYEIDTALDEAMQKTADTLFVDETAFPPVASDGTPCEAALTALDCATGEILCLCGGRDYAVQRGFNRAVQMKRQPGSAFKPVSVYAAAIDLLGCMPVTLLDDSPKDYDGYSPSNASGESSGTVTLREALVRSMNQATVNLLDRVGIEPTRLYAEKFGLSLNDSDRNYALALGSLTDGVSPAELCAAYCALGNGGTAVRPHAIREIRDGTGRTVFQYKAENDRVMKRESAYLLTDVLRDTARRGTAKALADIGFDVAAKTGTVGETDGGNRDVWIAAYTPELAVTVWMGYDEPDKHELPHGTTGGGYPARLAAAFMKANAEKAAGAFVQPDGIDTVLIDARSLREDIARPMLASENTPETMILREPMTSASIPRETSGLWNRPQKVETAYQTENERGQTVISFVAPDSVSVWRVVCVEDGREREVGRIEGEMGDFLSVTDEQMPASGARYYVVARQKYFEELGQIVEAEASEAAVRGGATLIERLLTF